MTRTRGPSTAVSRSRAVVASSPVASVKRVDTDHAGLIDGKVELRLHPCSVAPAEDHEKCGTNRPTRAGSSCNNAVRRRRGGCRAEVDGARDAPRRVQLTESGLLRIDLQRQ